MAYIAKPGLAGNNQYLTDYYKNLPNVASYNAPAPGTGYVQKQAPPGVAPSGYQGSQPPPGYVPPGSPGGQPSTYGYGTAPGGSYGYYEQQTPAGSFAAANQQNAGVSQANVTQASNPYIGQTGAGTVGGTATSGRNPMFGMNNPYLTSAIDAASGDAARNYNMSVAPMRQHQAAQSGSFGNTGVQQMQLEDQRNLQNTLGNIATGARMQDYAMQFAGGENQANRDTGVSQFNANLSQADLARNAQLAQNMGMFNASAANQGSQFNAGAQNQGNMFNAGQGNAMNMFNTGAANQMLEGARGRGHDKYKFDETLDYNIYNSNFNNGITGINTAQGIYDSMIRNGVMQNTLGSEESNAPMDWWQRLMSGATAAGGQGGTNSQPTYSDPWSQGLGTYAMLNSLINPRRP